VHRRRCGVEERAPTLKTTRTTNTETPPLDPRTRSQVVIRWRRTSGCEKRRLEHGNVLKLLGPRKSRSTRNGMNTKTVLQSICKLRDGRSVRRTISLILESEERNPLIPRLLRTISDILLLQGNTARMTCRRDHRRDPRRLDELQTHLEERSRAGDHQ